MRKYFLIFAFWKLTNMYLNGYEKGWPLFCPFKPNWWVHSNISGIFEQFSIRLCIKNMKTQETFKKKSGHTPVLCVRKYFLISALGASINDVYKNKGGGGLECIYWWRHCYYVDEGGRGSENCPNLVDVIYGRSPSAVWNLGVESAAFAEITYDSNWALLLYKYLV